MREDPTLYWPVLGAFVALGLAALIAWGYATVARVRLREARGKRQARAESKRLRIARCGISSDLHRAAASFPGGSYEGVER